jgi:hypothetical protein
MALLSWLSGRRVCQAIHDTVRSLIKEGIEDLWKQFRDALPVVQRARLADFSK